MSYFWQNSKTYVLLITQAGWTKGRLNCPNCQSRLGGFDFVSGADYPVHLIKSKIDYWKKSTNPTIGNSWSEKSINEFFITPWNFVSIVLFWNNLQKVVDFLVFSCWAVYVRNWWFFVIFQLCQKTLHCRLLPLPWTLVRHFPKILFHRLTTWLKLIQLNFL